MSVVSVSPLVLFVLLASVWAKQECGIQKAATNVDIGKYAEIGEFPWVAMLRYEIDDENTTSCVGSLINERFILTSAACATNLPKKLNSVRLGFYNRYTSAKDCDTCKVQDIEVDEVILEPDEDQIALLKLKTNAEFNDYVKPICLPLSAEQRAQSGDKVVTSGWGNSKSVHQEMTLKKKVVSKILGLSQCNIPYTDLNLEFTENEFCIEPLPGNNEVICTADAGGPVMFPKDDKWYQVGIMTFGVGCDTYFPFVNTKIDKHFDWIKENTN